MFRCQLTILFACSLVTEIGMKAAMLWKSFKALDIEGNNCLDVHDVVAAFAEIPGVDKKQALEVAYTILEVADDKNAGDDSGTISFTEYMTLLEGSTGLNFDDFVALVHTTGNSKKHLKEAETNPKKKEEIRQAGQMYDEVLKAAEDDAKRKEREKKTNGAADGHSIMNRTDSKSKELLGMGPKKALRRQSSGAIFRAIDATKEGSLICSYCSKTISAAMVKLEQKRPGNTRTRIKCPYCTEIIVVPRKTLAQSMSQTMGSPRKISGWAAPRAKSDSRVFTPNKGGRMYGGDVQLVAGDTHDPLADATDHEAEAAREETTRLSSLQNQYMNRIEEKPLKPRRIDQLLIPAESFPRTPKEQQRADALTREKPLRSESIHRLKAMYSNDFWV